MTGPEPSRLKPAHRERLEGLANDLGAARDAAHRRWSLWVAVGCGGALLAVSGHLLNDSSRLALLLPSAWAFAGGLTAAGIAILLEVFRLTVLHRLLDRVITNAHDAGYAAMPRWSDVLDGFCPAVRDLLLLGGGAAFIWGIVSPLWRVGVTGTL